MDGAYGPHNATLTVHTTRAGAAAKVGHDLTIEVGVWEATVEGGKLTLTADPRSLRVLAGSGGVAPLSPIDKRSIERTIRKQILPPDPITYADGKLTLNGRTKAVVATVTDAGGEATITQTDFGIKPHTAFFGALKVADDVRVSAALSPG